MRTLLLLLTALATGCGAVGHRQVSAPAPDGAAPSEGGPVILVIVDGLRRDVLAEYRQTLEAADDEPDWPSGIALLRGRGFRTALAERAESTLPAVGLGPLATLATGRFPAAHRVPANRFQHASADGRLRRYDVTSPGDAAHLYFGPGLAPLDGTTPPGLTAALGVPTAGQGFARSAPVVSVFDPFGWGTRWYVPASKAGISAMLPTGVGAAAAPLFDRSVRQAALDIARGPELPRVLTLYFRELLVESCRDRNRACEGDADVRARQLSALRRVDGHLARLLRTVRVAHPRALDRATVLLVGTGGVVDRPAHGPLLGPDALLGQIGEAAGDDCSAALTTAQRDGRLGVEVDGAAWLATVARAPAGQRVPVDATRRCLARGLEALTTRTTSPLAAAAWLDDGQPVARLHPASHDSISASRRPRTQAKLQRALTPADAPVGVIDALAILREGFAFADPLGPPQGLRGGLDAASVEIALLVASRRLDPTTTRALRTAPIELTDVAPTVAAVAGFSPASWTRPPFLAPRTDGTLVVPRNDRLVQPPRASGPGVQWQEADDAITVTYGEPGAVWPPDAFTVRFGGQRWAWDVDEGTFPDGSPCTYSESDDARQWRCVLPRDPDGEGTVFSLVRDPDPAEDAAEGAVQRFSAVVVPRASTPTVRRAELLCADAASVRINLDASDAAGLGRVSVMLLDGQAPGAPALATADVSLGAAALSAAHCGAGAEDLKCTVQAPHLAHTEPVQVPFPEAWLAHHRRARTVFGAPKVDLEPVHAATSALSPAARSAYLAVAVCSLSGRCVQRPLATDTQYAAARKKGCP